MHHFCYKYCLLFEFLGIVSLKQKKKWFIKSFFLGEEDLNFEGKIQIRIQRLQKHIVNLFLELQCKLKSKIESNDLGMKAYCALRSDPVIFRENIIRHFCYWFCLLYECLNIFTLKQTNKNLLKGKKRKICDALFPKFE